MGKTKRDRYLEMKRIYPIDFLPELPYKMRCRARAVPRKGTSDYTVLFLSPEPELEAHFAMNKNEIFIDVGANVGVYSLIVAKKYADKDINVIAIEAHPENFRALCRNIRCNSNSVRQKIQAINMAASDRKGTVEIFEHSSDGSRVGTSLYSLYSDNSIGKPFVKHSRILEVGCDTIDNILGGRRVNVMNIDIEGAEVLALKGARNTLKGVRKIVVEIHGNNLEPVKEILCSSGFSIETIEKSMTYIVGSK